MSDKEIKKKEILIRRGNTVSYDGDKLYRNNIEIPKIEEELNSSHKCNRPSHLRNYNPKFSKSIFLGSQIA